jgi:acetyltransferase
MTAPSMTEERVALPDGSMVRLRPVGPGDEAHLEDLLAHMSAEDVRRRFLAPIRALAPALLHRLTHPDPGHDLALAALPPSGDAFLGVGRFAADDDGQGAEFAVAVRSDLKGHGLGHLLMTRLIDAARARGFAVMRGDMLSDNDAMLAICRELGFTIAEHPEDPALLRASLQL